MAKIVKQESAWQNPWVWLLAGIMATTLLVNGTLITIAFMTPPGLVVDDYYDKGKAYLYTQAKEKEDAARLGWDLILDLPKVPAINKSDSYLIRAIDNQGQPIVAAEAEFAAFRPVENGHDFAVPMHDVGAGYYAADVDFSLPGNWDLIVTIKQGEDQLDIAKRIFVKK